MLTLRRIGPSDYTVREDGQYIGRIRYARERSPGILIYKISVTGLLTILAGSFFMIFVG